MEEFYVEVEFVSALLGQEHVGEVGEALITICDVISVVKRDISPEIVVIEVADMVEVAIEVVAGIATITITTTIAEDQETEIAETIGIVIVDQGVVPEVEDTRSMDRL